MNMENNPLIFLARRYGNEVRYDRDGNPSLFCRFPKMKSSDLDPSLPEHTHPAFIINGVEQEEILLGKYMGTCIDESLTGTIHSLSSMPPVHSRTADQLLEQCRAFGGGASGMTVADRGFVLLLAQKCGWNPGGNSDFGHCWADAYRFEPGKSVSAGEKTGWRGWLYECLISHTTSAGLAPDIAPAHWKRLRKIGGTEAYPELHTDNQNNLLLTLSGSGPMDWYLDGTPSGMCDVVGNLWEMDYGYRIVAGEIQILPNNDAADETVDLSASSEAWRAILPNAGDDGYTLVAPGTSGTLHWTWADGKITLDTIAPEADGIVRWTNFRDLGVNTDRIPYIPCILRELGLFPTAGSMTEGIAGISPNGEMLALRGGSCRSGSNMGLGAEGCFLGRDGVSRYCGVRIRTRDKN